MSCQFCSAQETIYGLYDVRQCIPVLALKLVHGKTAIALPKLHDSAGLIQGDSFFLCCPALCNSQSGTASFAHLLLLDRKMSLDFIHFRKVMPEAKVQSKDSQQWQFILCKVILC